MAELHVLARGIAEAFLAGAWSLDDLIERGAEALGERPRWLRLLAQHAMNGFDVQPEAEVLARFLARGRLLARENARNPGALRIRKVILAEPHMSPARGAPETFSVPSLTTEGDLATWLGLSIGDLRWLADPSGRLRRAPEGRLQHYSLSWQKKPTCGWRLLEAPKTRLKAVQRQLLHGILDHVPAHDAAHGFRRGRNVMSYVAPHVARTAILHVDLRDFFGSVRRARVRAIFATLGYPGPVARLLAGLCTTRVPLEAWDRAPRPSSAQEVQQRWRAGRFYRAPHLPQGAPTSPALANLCALGVDRRLAAAARACGATYTRYADDLAISGGRDFAGRARAVHRLVCSVVAAEGFVVNARKTRLLRQGTRQRITGVVVNVRPNVPRRDHDRLKATLHNCLRYGPASQNRSAHPDFRAHLTGRVAWVESVNPARGRKLRAKLDAITWPEVSPSPARGA
jgi:RNA-directed DNA polymerase